LFGYRNSDSALPVDVYAERKMSLRYVARWRVTGAIERHIDERRHVRHAPGAMPLLSVIRVMSAREMLRHALRCFERHRRDDAAEEARITAR